MTGNALQKLAKLLALLLLATGLMAQAAIPSLEARVTDTTGTLTAGQRATLERELAQFEANKGAQIAILVIASTEPEAIEQYSIRVVEQWKLGRKKVDDGLLLLIAKDDRTMRIEVGRGLEGAIPDAVAKRVIADTITPFFRQGDFYGGIAAGVQQIMALVDGEALPSPNLNRHELTVVSGDFDLITYLLPVLAVVGGLLRLLLGRAAAGLVGGVLTLGAGLFFGLPWFFCCAVAFFVALFIMAFGCASGYGGYYIGSNSGGFGGSDIFRGGGGGFSGGGASGKW